MKTLGSIQIYLPATTRHSKKDMDRIHLKNANSTQHLTNHIFFTGCKIFFADKIKRALSYMQVRLVSLGPPSGAVRYADSTDTPYTQPTKINDNFNSRKLSFKLRPAAPVVNLNNRKGRRYQLHSRAVARQRALKKSPYK